MCQWLFIFYYFFFQYIKKFLFFKVIRLTFFSQLFSVSLCLCPHTLCIHISLYLYISISLYIFTFIHVYFTLIPLYLYIFISLYSYARIPRCHYTFVFHLVFFFYIQFILKDRIRPFEFKKKKKVSLNKEFLKKKFIKRSLK